MGPNGVSHLSCVCCSGARAILNYCSSSLCLSLETIFPFNFLKHAGVCTLAIKCLQHTVSGRSQPGLKLALLAMLSDSPVGDRVKNTPYMCAAQKHTCLVYLPPQESLWKKPAARMMKRCCELNFLNHFSFSWKIPSEWRLPAYIVASRSLA
jgi:hypothetical protein